MTYRDLVVRSLKDHKVTPIDSPLGNEFVLDDEWHVEMDRDGAFALTITYLSDSRNKSHNKGFIVLSSSNDESGEQMLNYISERIEAEINKLRNQVA